MRISHAAAFSTTVFLFATLFSILTAPSRLRVISDLSLRQAFLDASPTLWTVAGWLWLLAIFSWMVVLVAFVWRYAPAHRVATMLQNGLMLIAAVLAISGVVIWMGVLPVALTGAATGEEASRIAAVVDALAQTLVGAGLFMGGLVTAWIGWDLLRVDTLTWPWGSGALVAGLAVAPSPFLLPTAYHLLAGVLIWCVWGVFLATRAREPSPYAEWL